MSQYLLSLLAAANLPASGLKTFLERVAAVSGGSTPSVGVTLVWRPGGTLSDTVVTTAEELFDRTEAIDGLVFVAVDASQGVPQITNARPYDASNILWIAFENSTPVPTVEVLAGAQVTNLCRFTRVIFDLQPNGAPVLVYPTPGTAIVMTRGASFINTGSTPAIVRTTPDALVFVLQEFSTLDPSGLSPVVDLGVDGVALVNVDDFSEWGDDTIIGGAASFVSCQYTLGSRIPNTLSGFTGTNIKNRFPQPSQYNKWCSQDGDDDSGDGSLERPYRTISRALQDNVGTPLVVNLMNGTYNGVVIPTSPVPRPSLTIQGCASLGFNEANITPGPSGSAIELAPSVAEAGFIRSLVLRNLNLDNDGISPCVRVVNAPGSPPNTFLDSPNGLWIENCFLNGNGVVALQVTRAGKVCLLNNQINSAIDMSQVGGGYALNNEVFFGTWQIEFDPTATGPLSGAQPFRFKSCDLDTLNLFGTFNVEIDKGTQGVTLGVVPSNFGAENIARLRCRGEFGEAFCAYDPADIFSHDFNFDQSNIDDFSAFYLVPGSAIRQVLSFRGGVSQSVGIDELMDLNAMDTQAIFYGAAGAGSNQGTIDRRFFQVDVSQSPVAFNVPIDPPFPTNAYGASFQMFFSPPPAVAFNTTYTPTSGAAFSHQSGPSAGGEIARVILTRFP